MQKEKEFVKRLFIECIIKNIDNESSQNHTHYSYICPDEIAYSKLHIIMVDGFSWLSQAVLELEKGPRSPTIIRYMSEGVTDSGSLVSRDRKINPAPISQDTAHVTKKNRPNSQLFSDTKCARLWGSQFNDKLFILPI